MNSNTLPLHGHLLALGSKYAVTISERWELGLRNAKNDHEISTWCISDDTLEGGLIPLFPWRYERRFVELRRIVETKTLEEVVLCRFSCVTDGTASDLNRILFREFDLLEWITGSPIVSVTGCSNANRFSNVIARLDNGTIASVEAGTTLPPGAAALDRHELIARRGVASDRVVDTHIPQQSVYLFERDGVRSWTDTDAELFGLESDETNAVRAALELAKHPETTESNIAQYNHVVELVKRVHADH